MVQICIMILIGIVFFKCFVDIQTEDQLNLNKMLPHATQGVPEFWGNVYKIMNWTSRIVTVQR